jgi:hypothetical protein
VFENGTFDIHCTPRPIGKRGLESKRKFKLVPINGVTAPDLSSEKLVHQIIIGPSISNALSKKTLERMLIQNGKASLVTRLRASSTDRLGLLVVIYI